MRGILGILAGVQVALAVITWWPSSANAPVAFLDVGRDAITEIEIAAKPAEGEEPDPVVLARAGDLWVVRSEAGYPARSEKIEELLGHLLGLQARDTVATTRASHDVLQVGDEEYGRRITVTADGNRFPFFVGASTSKSVNLRREDDDDVFRSSGVSEWAFSDAASSYYDPLYVSASPTEITAVDIVNANGELSFEKQGDAFTLRDLAEGEAVDAAAIDRFLRTVTTVRIAAPVGKEVDDAYQLGDVANGGARIDWTIAADNQSIAGGYAVGAEVGSDRYVKATDSQFVVRVPASVTARVRDATRSEFLAATE